MFDPSLGNQGGPLERLTEAVADDTLELSSSAIENGMGSEKVQCYEAGSGFRPRPGWGKFFASGLMEMTEEPRSAGIVGVLGESFGPRGSSDAGTGGFIAKKFADERDDFVFVAIADEVDAFLKTEVGKFAGQRGKKEGAGSEYFEDTEVGVLRIIIAADVDDDPGSAINIGDFFKGVVTGKIVGAELGCEAGEPPSTAAIDVTRGLADPAEFEIAGELGAIKKFAADGIGKKKSAGMASTGEEPVVSGMENGDVIEKV